VADISARTVRPRNKRDAVPGERDVRPQPVRPKRTQSDRVFALEREHVYHEGPAEPLLTDLDYRKQILWL
jgi:hypothetical protein